MFENKDFLALLADGGDWINSEETEKPMRLQTACGLVLLHLAVITNNAKDVSSLLKLGISSNSKLKSNKSALYYAVDLGFADIVDILSNNGANVHEEIAPGISLLHHAVSKGYADVVDALLFAGIDANLKDSKGLPLLYKAAENEDIDTAEVLYDHGAETFLDDTPLIHLAVAKNSLNAVRCFSALDFDFDILDESMDAPIYKAAKLENVTMINELIKCGADLNLRDSEGNSFLHIAVKEGNEKGIKSLLAAGMDVNITGGWWNYTPLHLASLRRNVRAAELLLKNKAFLNLKTSDGRTAYDIARTNCDSIMTSLLSFR